MERSLSQYANYNLWANTRFVARLQRGSDEVLDAPVPSSFPSLRATILHIRDAENVWWCRLTGTPSQWPAGPEMAPDDLLRYSVRLRDLVLNYSAHELEGPITYEDSKGRSYTQPVWQILMHCFNHSTQHRGQLITMMRVLGLDELPANDLVLYQRSLL